MNRNGLPPLFSAPSLVKAWRLWALPCLLALAALASPGQAAAQTMAVGNLVYKDANGNGVYDAGEGVAGVAVQLWNTSDPANPVLQDSLVTGSDGFYMFQGVVTGTYHVTVAATNFASGGPLEGLQVLPTLLSGGDDNVGQKGQFDFSPATNGISTQDFLVTPGFGVGLDESGFRGDADDADDDDGDMTQDFGFFRPLGIGNLVFADTNGNGYADPGEGVPGVDVQLFLASQTPGLDVPLADLLTDADGHFEFDGLGTGSYKLYIPPSQFQSGGPLAGALSVPGVGQPEEDDNLSEDGIDDPHPELNGIVTRAVSLAEGTAPFFFTGEKGSGATSDDGARDRDVDLTIDFGFVLPVGKVGVGNLVFVDTNNNGVFDDGEGVGGVTVQLFSQGQNPLTDTPVASVLTAGDGSYLISNLDPGSYFLFVPPSQFASGQPLFSGLSLPGTQTGDDDKGEKGLDTAHPETTGVQTAVFTLAVGTAPTDADIETGYNASTDNFQDANVDLTQDFGFILRASSPLSIGNLVFIDANHSGHYDAGEGVSGVLVQLFNEGDDPSSATPVATQLTGTDGDYIFDGLLPGRYFVHIAASSFSSGQPLQGMLSMTGNGGDDGLDDNVDENGIDDSRPDLNGISSVVITLAEGTEPVNGPSGTEKGFRATQDDGFDANGNMTIDFGFTGGCPTMTLMPSAVTDGIVGANYPAISFTVPGITSPLVWDIILGSLPPGLTLSSQGLLSGIPTEAGAYTFVVSATTGDLCTGGTEYHVTISPAPGILGVGNAIYFDANGNGVLDSGEGVDGVVVQLFRANDNPQTATPLATTTTVQGKYLFTGLQGGDYIVYVPASEFAVGRPLYNLTPVALPSGFVEPFVDDNAPWSSNALATADPAATGVSSAPFTLQEGQAPISGPHEFENGFDSASDDAQDSNVDLTIDLGFGRKPENSVNVTGKVFFDINGNGRFDDGEGINSVTVQLFAAGADPQHDAPLGSTITGFDGDYSFIGLAEGSYFVYLPVSNFGDTGMIGPAHYGPASSIPGVGAPDSLYDQGIDAPDIVNTGISSVSANLAAGGAASSTTIALGFYNPLSPMFAIGNLVFIDWNHSGHYEQGQGEEVAGVTVQLFNVGDDPLTATPIDSTVTDANGQYLLKSFLPGIYIVFIPPSEFANGRPLNDCFSMSGNGPDSGLDDDVDENGIDSPNPEVTGIRSVAIHLSSGSAPTNATGETGVANTSDDFYDSNYNLTVDFGFDPLAQPFYIQTATLPDGALGQPYNHVLIVSGGTAPYTWAVTWGALPDGVTLGADGSLTGIASSEGGYQFGITVTDSTGLQASQSYQEVFIGAPPTVGLGNAIYIDANHNGVLDSGEGAAGVIVQLFNSGDDPRTATPIQQTVTSPMGIYGFTGLNTGAYFVYIPASEFAVGKPLNGLISIPGVSGDDGVDDNLPGNDNGVDDPHPEINGIASIVVNLQPGTEPVDGPAGTETGINHTDDNASDADFNATIDLGFQTPCPTITLSPSLLPQATLGFAYSQLFQATGAASAVTFSVSSGSLPAGIQLGTDGTLSGTPTAQGPFAVTIHAAQADGCSADLPLTLIVNGPVGVGNLVFFDANGNGHADAGEGVDGVLVELYHSTDTPGTDTPITTATTSGGGFYLIDGLPPGSYLLHVPATMFASGAPLWSMKAIAATITTGDDDAGQRGQNAVDPTVTGVSTAAFILASGTEPTVANGETGLGSSSDDARDADVDLTQDFGFVDAVNLPATFADWANSKGLSGGNAGPLGNPDGDAFSNLMEYALGTNPGAGGDNPSAAFSLVHNLATSGLDVTLRRRHGGQGDLTYTLQVLPSLSGSTWTASSVVPTIVDNGDGTETLTFSGLQNDPAFSGASYGFVRIQVSLDADHDGTPEATDTSSILGWQSKVVATQNQTYAIPFATTAVFTGTVDGVAGNSLDVTTSAGSGSVAALLTGGLNYYAEVIGGVNQGQRWEVDPAASTATSIALLPAAARSTQSTVPASLAGDLIAVRPHWRVSDLFPPSDYHATNNPATADQILVWDATAKGYVTLWAANYFGQSHWHRTGDAVLTDTEDNRVIGPCDGLYTHPKLAAVSAFATGQLRTWKMACPLIAGTNFVGNPFPVAQSPLDRSMTFANGFTGSTNPVTADRIYFWNGDTAPATTYTTYQLFKAGSLEIWKIVGSTDLSTNHGTDQLFAPGSAAFINSIQGKPDWMIPPPSIP